MATYDNRHWLLSHVRNSFISTDDTGMCELVMLAEDLPKLLRSQRGASRPPDLDETAEVREPPDGEIDEERVSAFDCYPEMEHNDEEDLEDLPPDSYDLQHDMDFGIHRQRSNTAQRLEKMEYAQRKAAKIKVIKWEGPNTNLTEQEKDQLFAKKSVLRINKDDVKKKSLLSDQLQKCPHLPQKQYLEYAMFDGAAQFGMPTKTYKIFMTMLPEEHRNYPITICIISNAKIKDLIGLTCYKYSIANPEIALASIVNYNLHICEDDGEVDLDFPCLDINEACSKYGFTCLGIVDKSNSIKPADVQTCSIPEKGGFNVISAHEEGKSSEQNIPTRSATFDITEKLKQDRINRIMKRANSSVTFEEPKTMAVLYDMFKNKELRRGSNSAPTSTEIDTKSIKWQQFASRDNDALNRMKLHELSIEAPVYQSYLVQLVHFVRPNTKALIGISGEKIEIEPLIAHLNPFFWSRMKPVSYSIDSIVKCETVSVKNSTAIFRIHYSQSNLDSSSSQESNLAAGILGLSFNLKHMDFECEQLNAEMIVEKINMILNMKSTILCKENYIEPRAKRKELKKNDKKSHL